MSSCAGDADFGLLVEVLKSGSSEVVTRVKFCCDRSDSSRYTGWLLVISSINFPITVNDENAVLVWRAVEADKELDVWEANEIGGKTVDDTSDMGEELVVVNTSKTFVVELLSLMRWDKSGSAPVVVFCCILPSWL